MRHRITHRVRNINRSGAGVDHGLKDSAEKILIGSTGIFRRELNVIHGIPRLANSLHSLFQNILGRHPEFGLHVDWGRGNEGMNPRCVRAFNRLSGFLNVAGICSGQAADSTLTNLFGDHLDRIRVTRTGCGKSRLNNVHLELFELARNTDFFRCRH